MLRADAGGRAGVMISVVIPVYNAESTLVGLYEGLRGTLGSGYELIFVDDGSTDGSGRLLRGLSVADEGVRIVRMEHNCGQQEATLCGLAHARGEYVATMDADGQHPPELLPGMLARMGDEGLDIVYAVPRAESKRLGSGLRDALFYVMFPYSRGCKVSSYRVMRGGLAQRVVGQRRGFNYFSAMVFSQPVRAGYVGFDAVCKGGVSSYTFGKRLRLFLGIFMHYGPLARLFDRPARDFPVKERIGFD